MDAMHRSLPKQSLKFISKSHLDRRMTLQPYLARQLELEVPRRHRYVNKQHTRYRVG
jgi:hypothetical protein